MKIALDYDQTYSADPEFWRQFLFLARLNEHDVRIVTARDDRYDRTADLVKVESTMPVIYTRGIAKRWYCEHFVEGFVPDVWIDDKPEAVLQNSPTSPANLVTWRETRGEGPTLPIRA